MQYTLAFVACLICLAIASHPGRLNVQGLPVVNSRLVRKVNALATTWTAGLNEGSAISGATREQVKRMLGSRKGGAKLPVKKFDTMVDLPDNFDSRANWPLCPSIQAIRDQSACGSCFAFGAVEAMSDRICIALKMNVSLAAGDAAFCCDECGDGCNGGYPSSVWQYWQDTGIVEEGCYPYPFKSCDHHLNNTKNPCPSQEYPSATCPEQCDNSWNGPQWTTDRHKAANVYTIDDGESAIMQEIFTNGPVETGFTVYEDFLSYKSGVYQYTWGDELGGHAVKIIGWGITGGVKYWTVANSWNPDWGDQGFFRIVRGVDNCGFEDEVNGGVPTTSKKL